jgi:hypothetical protein
MRLPVGTYPSSAGEPSGVPDASFSASRAIVASPSAMPAAVRCVLAMWTFVR